MVLYTRRSWSRSWWHVSDASLQISGRCFGRGIWEDWQVLPPFQNRWLSFVLSYSAWWAVCSWFSELEFCAVTSIEPWTGSLPENWILPPVRRLCLVCVGACYSLRSWHIEETWQRSIFIDEDGTCQVCVAHQETVLTECTCPKDVLYCSGEVLQLFCIFILKWMQKICLMH